MDRLAAMETFVRVVEAGSFSRAAQQLNLGQSAVSKTVAQLEARLGVRLLQRSTRSLTDTGMLDRFTGNVENRAGLVSSVATKRLGAPEEVANAVLFLASEAAPFVTGAVLYVDGGKAAR